MKCKAGSWKDYPVCKKPKDAEVYSCAKLIRIGACHEGRLECSAYSPDCPYPKKEAEG